MRSVQGLPRRNASVATALAIGVLVAIAVTLTVWRMTRGDAMFGLREVASRESFRTVEPRLSGGFPHRPLKRSTPDRPKVAFLASAIGTGADSPADRDHAVGVFHLLAGDPQQAVEALTRAAQESERVDILTDQAAAYFELGRSRSSVVDLTKGYVAAARAIELDGRRPEPRQVQALILESLALREDAVEAWRAYLDRDAGSPWAVEARQHVDRLLRARTERDPKDDRVRVEEVLLGAWGDAVLAGLDERAAGELAAARRIGAGLTSDLTTADAAERIASAPAPARELAAAHVAYRDARTLMEGARDARARDAMRAAAVSLERAGSPLTWRARVYVATIEHYLGENDAALRDVEHILTSLRGRERRYPIAAGTALWTRGLIELARGRPHDASRSYTEARVYLQRANEASNLAGIETVLADVATYLGDIEAAWTHRLLALRWIDRSATYTRRQVAMAATALLATEHGDLALAELLTRRVGMAASRENDPIFAARALLGNARILRAKRGRDPEALRDLDRAAALLEPVAVSGTAIRLIADVAIARGEILASRDPAAAIRLLTAALGRLESLDFRLRRMRIELLLGKAHERAGDLSAAEGAYRRGINELEQERAAVADDQQRSMFTDTGRGLYDGAIRLAVGRRAWQDALRSVRRARSMGFTAPGGPRAELPATGGAPAPAAVLLEYYILPDALLSWLTVNDRIVCVRTPVAAAALEGLVADGVAGIRGARDGKRESTPLFRLLMAPVLSALPPEREVMISADGVLHRVPFGALYDETANRFFIERNPVSIVLGNGVAARSVAAYPSILVVAAPEVVPGLPRLDRVKTEAESVARGFADHRVLSGPGATAGAFLATGGAYTVVHFAGHALWNDRKPQLALLSMADRPLYAYEIEGRLFDRTRLVVLSACDSAGGRVSGVGLLSFARTFIAAGVPNVIGSLWSAEDDAAAALFHTFYAELATGIPATEALRRAQRAAIRSSRYRYPAAWATFQLYTSGDVERSAS